jgi:lipid II:glycine glycyltransferase (peptidoglycan interpeptide bridge formation enzyme)
LEKEQLKYIEIRPLAIELIPMSADSNFQMSQTFCFHKLDLSPTVDQLFSRFHKSCSQRKIRRAEREGLTYEEGRSESLIAKYYRLLLLTRRRHQLPPQPINWFYNLVRSLGDKAKIRVAAKNGRPLAAMLTLCYKNSVVYKYGCSDANFHNLGGMALLFWKAIQEAKAMGLCEFDLGRSDWDNPGLIAFKDHWGASRSRLAYYRYPGPRFEIARGGQGKQIPKWILGCLPDRFLTMVGRLSYKHFG